MKKEQKRLHSISIFCVHSIVVFAVQVWLLLGVPRSMEETQHSYGRLLQM